MTQNLPHHDTITREICIPLTMARSAPRCGCKRNDRGHNARFAFHFQAIWYEGAGRLRERAGSATQQQLASLRTRGRTPATLAAGPPNAGRPSTPWRCDTRERAAHCATATQSGLSAANPSRFLGSCHDVGRNLLASCLTVPIPSLL